MPIENKSKSERKGIGRDLRNISIIWAIVLAVSLAFIFFYYNYGLKILKATELLDYTNNKVKEISFYLGYADPYYFTKDFTKRMGLSPRQYRNRIGKK